MPKADEPVRSDPESDNTTKRTDSAWNTNAKVMLIKKKKGKSMQHAEYTYMIAITTYIQVEAA